MVIQGFLSDELMKVLGHFFPIELLNLGQMRDITWRKINNGFHKCKENVLITDIIEFNIKAPRL